MPIIVDPKYTTIKKKENWISELKYLFMFG